MPIRKREPREGHVTVFVGTSPSGGEFLEKLKIAGALRIQEEARQNFLPRNGGGEVGPSDPP